MLAWIAKSSGQATKAFTVVLASLLMKMFFIVQNKVQTFQHRIGKFPCLVSTSQF